MQQTEWDLLGETLRKTMATATGPELYAALIDLGWRDMLAEFPEHAAAAVFRLLGETGTHAPVLNDVIAHAAGRPFDEPAPLPFAGGSWVRWDHPGSPRATLLDADLPVVRVDPAPAPPLAAGRRALGWWLVGSASAMLDLARSHALDRVQFGRPLAGFQAVRHRLAETLVAIEGAEATLAATSCDFGALLGKAAAGRAALTTARHCQQVLGGIGFTAEHDLHRHIRRTLVLDGLLGSARELTREAGAHLRDSRTAPRLVDL
ncbi:acyl-CoA dehydrogenase family protein [Nocardia goodfellowii]